MISSVPCDPRNSHHFVASSYRFVVLEKVLWTLLWTALWMELGMGLATEPVRELSLLTLLTLLLMPRRHRLHAAAPVRVWVLATVPPKALFASRADMSTSAYRSRSQRQVDRPTLSASIAYPVPSAPLFGARVFSDQSRAGAVSSPLSLCQRSSWWSKAGKRQPRR